MNPAFTTSAKPATDSFGDSVASRSRSQTTARRRPERADEVLALGGVDAGLAADGGIDHAEHGRGHLHDLHAAQPRRGDEAGEVGHRSPAEADDRVGAGEVRLPHHLPAERGDLDALAGFGVGDLGEQHLARAVRHEPLAQLRRGGAAASAGARRAPCARVGARASPTRSRMPRPTVMS